jgi:putative (di)nucleoside polyphosphate hydrolase
MEIGILDLIKLILRWIFDRKVRLQLSGYRPEVICVVKENVPLGRYLVIKPNAEPSIWVPPHEGILLNETVEEAAIRCLRVELGLEEANVQFRKSVWLGKRVLPEERWGERDLEFSLRGIFSKHKMIGKAYFGAYIIADALVAIKPNGAEVSYWEWVGEEEFLERMETNSTEKAHFLRQLYHEFIKSKEIKESQPG